MSVSRRTLLAACAACAWPLRGAAADLPALIAGARGSVLPIGTYSATDSPRFGFRGTCFVVGDGTLVATNAHVIPEGAGGAGGAQMVVMASKSGNEGELRHTRVAALDRWRDLALLQIDGAALTPLPLAEADTVREGQSIVLMGYPIGGALGFTLVSHHGIVSAITPIALPAPSAKQLDPRAVMKLRNGNFEVLQLDATAYPGNSGGPVLDADTGQVIGIVNMVFVKGSRESALTSPTGISYAIPIEHLRELLHTR